AGVLADELLRGPEGAGPVPAHDPQLVDAAVLHEDVAPHRYELGVQLELPEHMGPGVIAVEQHHHLLRLKVRDLGPNSVDDLFIDGRTDDVIDPRVLHLGNGHYVDRDDVTSTEEVKDRGHVQGRATSVRAALHNQVHV